MRCICCSAELAPLPYQDGFLGNSLLQCKACAHIQLMEAPSREVIRQYYAGAYAKNRNAFVGPAYFEVMRKRAIAQRKLIERFVPLKNKCVCDVGCGFGSFLEEIQTVTTRAFGVDYDDSSIRHCRERGLDVRKIENESEIDFSNKPIDVITLSHVVEHLNELPETMTRIGKSASYIFIEVPGYRADLSGQFADQEGHISFFNEVSLRRLVERLGFQILYLKEAGPSLDLYWGEGWWRRLYKRVIRRVSRDWFFDQYEKERVGGIWIRAVLKSVL
jgi:SAM-dependent methyltransferase